MLCSPRALVAASLLVLLAGCGGGVASSSLVPPSGSAAALHGRAAPAAVRSGIYVAEYSSSYVYGYPTDNSKNGPPVCNVYNPNQSINDIAVDGSGNLILPLQQPNEILVYTGRKLCGPWLATIADPYGAPTGAAANDAVNGTIAVANIFDLSGSGSISLCSVSAGCTQNLTNPNLYEVGGVAMDAQGDCWGSGLNQSYTGVIVYFAGCTGPGVLATGTAQAYGYGGVDIDKHGNLVVVSIPTSVYVYRGCKPKCKKLGGPFALQGSTIFGHLNKKSTAFAAGDEQYGQVDVYAYKPTSLTYQYSFNNGLSYSATVSGVAYSPRSKE
jgi:hypothetical protein